MDAFRYSAKTTTPISYKTRWQAPSNIALIKYWGKEKNQIPKNPSLSFTLQKCVTETSIEFQPKPTSGLTFDFFFEGKPNPNFLPKLNHFFDQIRPYVSWLDGYHLTITSDNSFPHSSGIASSASAMAALALGVMDAEREMDAGITDTLFTTKASFLARLGSGSAARSVEGPITVWGKTPSVKEASNDFACKIDSLHTVFTTYQDTVLIVEKGSKSVSSSQGHALMNGHPFANQRFEQAQQHLHSLLEVMKEGNLDDFIRIVESEALTLHAMMMTSQPYYLLMEPQTLSIIQKVWAFRKETHLPLCFTLDAGANIHLLYPKEHAAPILDFIKNELSPYCQQGYYIEDEVGRGAKKMYI